MICNLDGNILLYIQEYIRNDMVTPFMKLITHLGDNGMIWIVLTALLLLVPKTRKVGIMCVIALLGALLVDNVILKNLVARIRPYEVVDGLQRIIEKQHDYSFPSGHTGSSFAAAVVMFRCLPKKFGIPAIILATLIGISRLYVGVHYPTDVVGGLLVGIFVAMAACQFGERFLSQKKKSW